MSIHGSTRVGTVPGARTPDGSGPEQPGYHPATPAAPSGALFSPTGEHIGLLSVAKALRQPVPGRPGPSALRLLGLCAAAAGLSLAGIVVGLRGWFGLVTDKAAGWYLPVIVVVGVFGVVTAASGFLTVHRRYAPWIMLSVSGVTLLTAMIVTAVGLD